MCSVHGVPIAKSCTVIDYYGYNTLFSKVVLFLLFLLFLITIYLENRLPIGLPPPIPACKLGNNLKTGWMSICQQLRNLWIVFFLRSMCRMWLQIIKDDLATSTVYFFSFLHNFVASASFQ